MRYLDFVKDKNKVTLEVPLFLSSSVYCGALTDLRPYIHILLACRFAKTNALSYSCLTDMIHPTHWRRFCKWFCFLLCVSVSMSKKNTKAAVLILTLYDQDLKLINFRDCQRRSPLDALFLVSSMLFQLNIPIRSPSVLDCWCWPGYTLCIFRTLYYMTVSCSATWSSVIKQPINHIVFV